MLSSVITDKLRNLTDLKWIMSTSLRDLCGLPGGVSVCRLGTRAGDWKLLLIFLQKMNT